MTHSSDDDDRLRAVLETWYELTDRGETPELAELCDHDETLEAQIRELVRGEEDITSEFGPAATLPEIPERLGDFVLRTPIGRGGTSHVFLAEQQSLRRLVALKVLDAPNDDMTQRLRREAHILATLDHPNIVAVYDVGEDQGLFYIAMKWLTGRSLDDRDGPIPPTEVARIGVAVARALDEAHASGIVHRDVKPANIILDDRTPYVVDFGLAKTSTEAGLTRDGVVPGTLAYIAPERLRGEGDDADPRSDVYSLGATLYELLANRSPFHQTDPERLIHAALTTRPPSLGLGGYERDLETVVRHALEKEPERRYSSAAAFAEDLERWRTGTPIRARRIGPLGRSWRAVRRRPIVTSTIGGLLVVAVTALMVATSKSRESRRDIELRIDAIETAITDGDLDGAQSDLALLPDEERPTRDVVRLERRLATRLAFEQWLDDLLDRAMVRRPHHFERLRKEVIEGTVDDLDPRLVSIANAVTHLYSGRTSKVIEEIDHLEAKPKPHGGRGRATVALRQAASQMRTRTSIAIAIPDDLEASADEHALTAAVLRFAGATPMEVETEVGRARSVDSMRVFVMQAITATEADRFDVAWERFSYAANLPVRRPKPLLRRNLARLLYLRGEASAAEAELKKLDEAFRGSVEATLMAQIVRAQGREEDANAIVAEAERRYADDWGLLIRRHAELLSKTQTDDSIDMAKARTLLDRARRLAHSVYERQVVDAVSLFHRIHELLGPVNTTPLRLDEDRADAVAELSEDAIDLLDEASVAYARATAALVLGQCRLHLTGVTAALTAFDEGTRADPTHVTPRLRYVIQFYETIRQVGASDARQATLDRLRFAPALHADRLFEHTNSLLDQAGRTRVEIGLDQMAQVALIHVLMAKTLRRPEEIDRRRDLIKRWIDEGHFKTETTVAILRVQLGLRDGR